MRGSLLPTSCGKTVHLIQTVLREAHASTVCCNNLILYHPFDINKFCVNRCHRAIIHQCKHTKAYNKTFRPSESILTTHSTLTQITELRYWRAKTFIPAKKRNSYCIPQKKRYLSLSCYTVVSRTCSNISTRNAAGLHWSVDGYIFATQSSAAFPAATKHCRTATSRCLISEPL